MTHPEKFDVLVLGAGPGGYPAAIKAAQGGKKVGIIETKELGGTCLNRGCIPTKALLHSAKMLKMCQQAQSFGIQLGDIRFDYQAIHDKKNQVVAKVRRGLETLLKSNQITVIQGFGKFLSNETIEVGGTHYSAHSFVIATGSECKSIPLFPVNGQTIHDSTSILELNTLPQSLTIIGGGYIGCEFASLFNSLGVDITIVEMEPRILPQQPQEVAEVLARAYRAKKIKILTNTQVTQVTPSPQQVTLELSNHTSITTDMCLVSIGRELNTKNIGLENTEVQLSPQGLVQVNRSMQTTVPHIYAVGDISSPYWLAHVASHQGMIAAEHLLGNVHKTMSYHAIPSVVFTDPEIGLVGMGLQEALDQGYQAKVAKFPFQALGKAQAEQKLEGFAQIVQDATTGQILGAQVVGNDAANLIAEMGVAIANELTIDCIAETIHAHPTTAEVWLEAAMMAQENPLHIPPQKHAKVSA